MHPLRTLKQKLKRAYYASLGFRQDIDVPVETVNPGEQAWYHAADSLHNGDVIYSLGLATNIEFDLHLMAKYGVEIHGFDPTPESVDWIRQQTLPPSFQHHPVAIGGHDGEMIFELPQAVGQCARGIDPNLSPAGKTIVVPCKKLSSIAADLGHKRIALLKMDIEGSEYGVIEDILNNTLKVDQILVEFHHRFPGVGISKTLGATAALRKAGYRLFHVSPWCEEFAFIRS